LPNAREQSPKLLRNFQKANKATINLESIASGPKFLEFAAEKPV
jgi:hypothetical protein